MQGAVQQGAAFIGRLLMQLYVITALVFVHFVLAAALLFRVLHTDYLVLKNYHAPLGRDLFDYIAETRKFVWPGLAGLVASGALLVINGVATVPEYMNNPKLWVKFLCVAALAANGWWVHRLSRRITPATVPAQLPCALSIQLSIAGAVNSASWLFICWLGIARSWNKVVLFEDVLAHYGLVLLLAVCLSMAVNIRFTQDQNRRQPHKTPVNNPPIQNASAQHSEPPRR